MPRQLSTVLAAMAVTMLVAGPAMAHVTVTPSRAPADDFARLAFRVPHGCDGAATNSVSVQIPEGVVSVTPEFVTGWDTTTEIGTYDEPVELHGEQVSEGVTSVTWTARDGQELPDGRFREFGLSVKLPATGDTLYFPTVQECVDGSEAAWIQLPSDGGQGPDHPAPAVTLTAEGQGHGGDDTTHAGDAASPAPRNDTGQDGGTAVLASEPAPGTDPLAMVALGVAVVGLVLGGAGLATARRRR